MRPFTPGGAAGAWGPPWGAGRLGPAGPRLWFECCRSRPFLPPSGGPLRPKAHVCHAGLALEVTARGLCVPMLSPKGEP